MASVYFWVPDIRDKRKESCANNFTFYAARPRGYFRRHHVWQRRCICLVQLRKAYMMFISGFSETAMTFIMMLLG